MAILFLCVMPVIQRSQRLYAFIKDEANNFVLKIVGVYILWKIIYYLLLNTSSGLERLWQQLMIRFGSFHANLSSKVLNLFGEETYHKGISIVYTHSGKIINVAEHCLAIPAMVVFTGSILFFNGSRKNKLWFIPLGIFAVVLINTMRITILAYAFEHFSSTSYFVNHSVVYVVITYALILLLIIWWMKRFNYGSGTRSI